MNVQYINSNYVPKKISSKPQLQKFNYKNKQKNKVKVNVSHF